MAGTSKIEWTESTWNPVVGCSIVSPGCTNCYAMRDAWRKHHNPALPHYHGLTKLVKDKPVWTGVVRQSPEHILLKPLKTRKPTVWFVNSMSDLFHESIPDEWIVKVLDVIRRTSCDGGSNCGTIKGEHTYQVLTKRAARMASFMPRLRFNPRDDRGLYLSDDGRPSVVMKNLWLGVSAERQQEADERIPHLLQTPAVIRFVSLEPLLGPIDLGCSLLDYDPLVTDQTRTPGAPLKMPRLDWAIVGGESGKNARPMHPDWVRSLQRQCEAAGVQFFFKQRGEYTWVDNGDYDGDRIPDLPQNWRERTDDKYICMRADGSRADGYGGDSAEFFYRVGKKAAGRLLDGREWNQMPEVRP